MKNLIHILAFTLLLTGECFAQLSDWHWAKSAGSFGGSRSNSVATDANGNLFITGRFFTSITFDSIALSGSGVYIAKYNSSGNVLWAKSILDGYYEGENISVDDSGNVYVTGSFYQSAVFDTDTLTGVNTEAFIAKYDSNGNLVWAKNVGGSGYDKAMGISTDAYGNTYITGIFSSGSIIFGSDTLSNSGSDNIFIAKYSTTGNVIWAKKAGGTGSDVSNSITTDALGNIYITGNFSSPSIAFDNDTLSGNNLFIAKYDTNGSVQWAKGVGNSSDKSNSIATDLNGNVYLTGMFANSILLGNILLNGGGVFISKFDSLGNVKWAQKHGGPFDEGRNIKTDGTGNIYLTGSFYSTTIIFGSDTLINSGDSTDVFLAQYNSAGNIQWVKAIGGGKEDFGTGISIDINKNIYLTGYYSSYFLTIGNDTLFNQDYEDIFIAKLSICNISQPSVTVNGSTAFCSGDSVILTSSNADSYRWTTGDTTSSITVFASGNYSVTISDSIGCYASSAPQTINVNSPVPVINGLTSFCDGDSAILTSLAAISYLWSTGDTTSSITVSSQGGYSVTIIDSLGCSGSSAPVTVTVNLLPVAAGSFLADKFKISFLDNSSGAASYLWNFGDGNTSTLQNPVHNYITEGTYTVLLKAYSDSGCMDIDTLMVAINTNNISGIVYRLVITNVIPAGKVYLIEYSNTNTSMATIDSASIANDGTYQFRNVFADNYLVLARPDNAIIPGVFDSYYQDASAWNTATILNLLSDTSNINIGIKENPLTNGTGRISGQLVQGNIIRSGPGDPMAGITISLVSQGSTIPLKFDITNTSGNFTFTNIPAGTYYLWPDITGIPVDTTGSANIFSVTATDTAFDVKVTVDSNLIYNTLTTSINELERADYTLQIYPNPFNTSAIIKLKENEKKAELVMHDLTGREVNHQVFSAGQTSILINRNNLPEGVYFIRLTAGEKIYNSKVIIR